MRISKNQGHSQNQKGGKMVVKKSTKKKAVKKSTVKKTSKVVKKVVKKITKKVLEVNSHNYEVNFEEFLSLVQQLSKSYATNGRKNVKIFNHTKMLAIDAKTVWGDIGNGNVITVEPDDESGCK